MATPKIIPYQVKLRSTTIERSLVRPIVYTNDLRSAEFQFQVTDMQAGELSGATATTLLYMRDGSFFQNPKEDVELTGTTFSYLLKEDEGNHAGIARIQLVVRFNEGLEDEQNFPSQLYDFEIVNGLETQVAQQIMIHDWATLTREARAYIDEFAANEILREAEFDNNEFDRNAAFNLAQTNRQNQFSDLTEDLTATLAAADANIEEFDVALQNGIVAAKLAEKLEDFEEINNSRLLSTERQLEQKAQQSDLEVERVRINNFTSLVEGSTTGDAELADGRILSDSSIYPNIGSAIRSVDKDLKAIKTALPYDVGLVDKTNLIWYQGNLNGNTGEPIANGNTIYSSDISLLIGDNNVLFNALSGYRIDVAYWDDNDVYKGHTFWSTPNGSAISETILYPKIKIIINNQDSTLTPETVGETGFSLQTLDRLAPKNMAEQLANIESNTNALSKSASYLVKNVYDLNDFTVKTVYNFETLNIGDTASSSAVSSQVENKSIKIPVTPGDFIRAKGSAFGTARFIAIVDNDYKIKYIVDKSIDTFCNIEIDVEGYALINGHSTYDVQVMVQGSVLNSLNEDIDTLKLQKITYENPIYAPSPQLAANTNVESDFNADDCTSQDIYDYLDVLVDKYPNYLSKEIMGKDESGTLDCNRYIACKRYYNAWMKSNYPKMYAWSDGTATYYFESNSPRIGDKAYTTPYIGEYQYNVTAVNNADRQITVDGKILTRDEDNNVSPSLVYTSITNNSVGKNIVNRTGTDLGMTISSITDSTMVDSNGVSYVRYALGDLGSFNNPLITIVLWGNEHGPSSDPRECAIILARMINDICHTKHTSNRLLNFIKNYCKLVVIPVANPHGFDHESRNNYNNVNINRNYDCVGWSVPTDSDKGVYGGSEKETQYIMNTLKDSNANVGIDIHCLGHHSDGRNDGLCHYAGKVDSNSKIRKITEVMKAQYNLNLTSYGLGLPSANAQGSSYLQQENISGGLIEIQAREGKVGDVNTVLHSPLIMEANYTLLLETLYMWMTDFNADLSL